MRRLNYKNTNRKYERLCGLAPNATYIYLLKESFSSKSVYALCFAVGIFEERTDDPALYENHEHVLRLMEKFLFIAAPVQFPDEESENGGADEQVTQVILAKMLL